MIFNIIDEFLKQDNIGMQEANFSTTRYIASLLIQKKNIEQVYQEMSTKENQCEEIISQIIDQKYDKFNPMINKPQIYGKAYDELSHNVKQSRKRLQSSKELLSSKSAELKYFYYQNIYYKEIISTLNKLKTIRSSIKLIQTQALSQPYEGSLECRKIKSLISIFPKQESFQIQYINKGFNLGLSQILGEFQNQLKEFFFLQRGSILKSTDAQKYYDLERKVRDLKSLSEILQFIKANLPEVTLQNDDELELCLIDQQLNSNELIISYNQLKRFIQMSFQFNDFDAVKQYVDNNTSKTGDINLNINTQQTSLLNIFLCIKGCTIIRKTNELLNKHFEDFKYNLQDLFTKSLTIFIKRQNPNDNIKISLFGELNFSSFATYKIISQFFKKLIAYAMIILRKQVLFGKTLHCLNVDVDENTLLLSLSELCRQLFWQINVVLSMFYKSSKISEQNKGRDVLDVRNEYHLFIQTTLQQLIKPSPLYYLLQRHLLDEVLQQCIESLKVFMRVEPIFKEPIDNEIQLQQELSKSIYLDCIKQLNEGVKNVVRNVVSLPKRQNKSFIPQINYQMSQDVQDQQLKQMLNDFHLINLKMQIPESIQFCYLIHELNVIDQITNLQIDFIQILNWILNVYLQEIRIKLKASIQGSQSEILMYNQDKQALQKKLLSYMEWKCKFQQSNPLLNDGINTQQRLQKAKGDKQFRFQLKQPMYQGYMEYLVNQVDESKTSPLIRSKEVLHTLGALHDNIHAFLTFTFQSIERYLDKIDQQYLIKQLDIQQKDVPLEQQSIKIQLLKIFQLRCEQQSFQLEQFKNKNAIEIQYNDNVQQSFYRFLKLCNEIFLVQFDVYLVLRFEFHMRHLLMTNIQEFNFEYINFSQTLKESIQDDTFNIITQDFWTIFKASLKAQFIRQKDFNPKKIQMILKDLNVMKDEMSNQGKRISHLRRYFKLYLVNGQDIEKFLKINAYKYKFEQIQEYCKLVKMENAESLRKYCL
ncbi:unnamed protein product [Paramecium octaurelia]|uniref:Exocyst complex component Sec8 N-terminal domain-containing protein n=1 Tax=Paramecium octaurelia TaxID=43137 RepID=A0A8S1U906_PAROT|nr:unnamed protein product [Paramecium octaurelia]